MQNFSLGVGEERNGLLADSWDVWDADSCSWDQEELLRSNVLGIITLRLALPSPVLSQEGDKGKGHAWLRLLHNGVWGCSESRVLAGWLRVPSGEPDTGRGVLQHITPAACLAWGLLGVRCRELGRGQPKGPGPLIPQGGWERGMCWSIHALDRGQ